MPLESTVLLLSVYQLTFFAADRPIRSARWIGEFDPETASYPEINHDNIQHALDVISLIVDRYSGHPAVLGLEPVNEPWQYTPEKELKQFYWEGYLIVKKGAPYWKYIMHDSFRFDTELWGGFMDGCVLSSFNKIGR